MGGEQNTSEKKGEATRWPKSPRGVGALFLAFGCGLAAGALAMRVALPLLPTPVALTPDAPPQVVDAPPQVEDVPPPPSVWIDPGVSLSAKASKKKRTNAASVDKPVDVNIANVPLSEFAFPDEKEFLRAHGIEQDSTYKDSVHRLRRHLVGTAREKYRAVKECEKFEKKSDLLAPPSGENLGCLYWRLQQLSKQERKIATKAVAKAKKARLTARQVLYRWRPLKSIDDWRKLADAPYQGLLSIVKAKSLADVRRLGGFAKADPDDCRLTAARAAYIRNLEDLLPEPEAWEHMNATYEALAGCLSPRNEAFEVVHLRMGLLHLERGELNKAGTKFELALRAIEPDEESRALFWRGYVLALENLAGGKVQAHENPYWGKLIDKFPLTLHALVADEIQGAHSFSRVEKRPSPRVVQYVGNTWDKNNLAAFVMGLLIARKESVSLERWSRYLNDNVAPVDFATALWLAKAHERAGNVRAAIKVSFGALRDFGAGQLNPEVLEMMYPLHYEKEVLENAKGVDASLVFSLMRQESSFNPRATSPVGARGLMQVMPNTGKRLWKKGKLDLYDPEQNIIVGSRYLANLLKSYKGNYVMTIASYNAGPRPVLRWKERYNEDIPLLFSDLVPYPETRNYVSGLMRNMHWYRALINRHAARAPKLGAGGEAPWTAATLVPESGAFGLKADGQPWRLAYEESRWLNASAAQADIP